MGSHKPCRMNLASEVPLGTAAKALVAVKDTQSNVRSRGITVPWNGTEKQLCVDRLNEGNAEGSKMQELGRLRGAKIKSYKSKAANAPSV